jgi:hypothetical protein
MPLLAEFGADYQCNMNAHWAKKDNYLKDKEKTINLQPIRITFAIAEK